MNFAGIICEYNPLHNGHIYQLNQTAQNDGLVVCAMSGNFVQRGELACLDKYTRAKHACMQHADIVIEIPPYFAINSANLFAFGAVSALNCINGFSSLSFGSECGSIEKLCLAKNALDKNTSDPAFLASLKGFLATGQGYPSAYFNANSQFLEDEQLQLLRHPNNILALEYLGALKAVGSAAQPLTQKRLGAGFKQTQLVDGFVSASGLRTAKDNNSLDDFYMALPKYVFDDFSSATTVDQRALASLLHYKIGTMTAQEIEAISDVCEGFQHRIKAVTGDTFDAIIKNLGTKRYTAARVRRILLRILLGIDNQNDILKTAAIPYLNVLAIKQSKLQHLGAFNVPVITKPSDKKRFFASVDSVDCEIIKRYQKIDEACDNLFYAFNPLPSRQSMVIIKD